MQTFGCLLEVESTNNVDMAPMFSYSSMQFYWLASVEIVVK